ncbi:MAG TPA: DinB family protein [Gemmatimonadales bacterium]|jgi:uncharacterized damage-inducible protein DinB|nr:DinB family protein [Gemmatimonadales bacterium]
MKYALIAAVLFGAAAPAVAQQGGPVVGAVTPRFAELSGYLIKTAEQVPETLYAYKPNPAVRSLGQLIGHVANAHYLFCSTAMGEPMPKNPDYEKVTDKATLVAAMKASVAYCDRAYKISDADAMQQTKLFGSTVSRLGVLVWNATHDGEHYGNLVVYMRINGITPPSSQGGN